MRGIKIEINKSALEQESEMKMFFCSLRGGICNAIYGFLGVSGKTNDSMMLEARVKGSIKIWFSSKYDRDKAFSFCTSVFRTPNHIAKRISLIKRP